MRGRTAFGLELKRVAARGFHLLKPNAGGVRSRGRGNGWVRSATAGRAKIDGWHRVTLVGTRRSRAAVDHVVREVFVTLADGKRERAVHRGLDLFVIGRLVNVQGERHIDGDD